MKSRIFNIFLLFVIVTVWIFSGWPQIVSFPPEVNTVKAAAVAGDYLIMRNNAATDSITTSNLDATWDTQVASNGSSITYSAGTFTLAAGKYLVMYNERFNSTDTANNLRAEIQGRLVVGGVATTTAAGQAYMRKEDGSGTDWQDDGIVNGAGIVEIANDSTSLVTRFYRTDSVAGTNNRYPGWGGVTILALDSTWNYARYVTNGDKTANASQSVWADIIWDTNLEQDAGFSRTSGDITITSSGRYLVTVSVPMNMVGTNTRTEYGMRLTLNNTQIEGTDVSTYMRGYLGTNDGVMVYSGIINVAASDILAVEHIRREGTNGNYLTGSNVEIVQLPAGNETIIAEATTGEMNPATLTEFAWDTTAYIDTAGFTMANGTDSFFNVDVSDDYLLFATHKTNNANTRTYASGRFSVNDTIIPYGAGGEYGRNTATADQPGYSFGTLATGVPINAAISLENIYLEVGQLSQTVNHGAMSALRWGSVFTSTIPKTEQLHFRWRDDTTALNTTGGWMAVEDSNVIGNVTKNTTTRLRVEVANSGASVESSARTYELQFGLKSSTCSAVSTWTGVADASDAFEMVDSTNISPDGQATTALLANTETYSFTAGEGRDVADTTGSIGPLATSAYSEIEYSFRPTSEAVTGDTYCFRLYDTTAASVLDVYAGYPEITMNSTDVSYSKTIMEWGTQASVGDDAWTTVTFAGNYTDPIFVCSSEYNANIGNESDTTADSVVCRVQSVGATSAQVRLQEPGTLVGAIGNLTAETIHWMVVEAGEYNNADIKMEAFKYTSTVTDGKSPVNWTGEQQTLVQSYTNPVVLGQVMTTNDTAHSAFWAHNGSNGAPTSALLYAGKHISEDTTTTRSNETVGVIVIEQANSTVNSIVYESRLQTQTIDRIDDSTTQGYTFNTAFSTTPSVAIVSLAGVSGTDGPYPSLYGTSILSTTNIDLTVMETEIVDTEQSGNTEFVPYIVFESAGTYATTSTAALDQDTFRFYENADAIQPTVALGNENTAITNVADTTALRIRSAIQTGDALGAGDIQLKLQYGQGATCSAIASWTDVGATTSVAIWRGYDNATPADGASISASLLNATTNALESYEEENNSVAMPTLISDGSRGEWDWVVQNNGATGSTDYCFRAVMTDGSVMEYTVYPKLTTAVGGGPFLTFVISTDSFPNLTPGTSVFATSTLSINTDNSTGWSVTLSGDDRATGNTVLDLNSDASVGLTDQLEWIPGAATTTVGNAVRISSLDNTGDVLAFRTMTASGTLSFISTNWWGSSDSYVDDVNSLWAGMASSTASNLQIGNSSVSSGGSPVLNTVLYYLDVPTSQQTGVYSGGITFTAIMN